MLTLRQSDQYEENKLLKLNDIFQQSRRNFCLCLLILGHLIDQNCNKNFDSSPERLRTFKSFSSTLETICEFFDRFFGSAVSPTSNAWTNATPRWTISGIGSGANLETASSVSRKLIPTALQYSILVGAPFSEDASVVTATTAFSFSFGFTEATTMLGAPSYASKH
jgi:hypothetical protein